MLSEEKSLKLSMSTEALIDFGSPEEDVSLFQHNYTCRSPLIPCPESAFSPTNDNPFDIAVKAAGSELRTLRCLRPVETGCSNMLIQINNREEDVVELEIEKQVQLTDKGIPDANKEGGPCKLTESEPPMNNEEVGANATFDKSSGALLETFENDNDIRVAIAKRVSSCIQKALNCSYSRPDPSGAVSPVCEGDHPWPELDVSRSVAANRITSRQQKGNHRCHSGSSPDQQLSHQTIKCNRPEHPKTKTKIEPELMNNEMLTMNPSLQQHILAEARKVAEYIQKLGEGKKYHEVPDAHLNLECFDDVEDLMSVEPNWDVFTFSDEELDENGLPILKLSIIRRSDKNKSLSNSDSEALTRFKNRNRTSLDLSAIGMGEEKLGEKDQKPYSSVPDGLESSPDKETLDTYPPNIVALPEPSDIKLRTKKASDVPKKGPMRAVVPLQKMTRKIADKISSPLRGHRKSPTQSKEKSAGPVAKDHSFSPIPVAASTPHKQNGGASTSDKPLCRSTPRSRFSRRDSNTESSKRSSSVNSRRSNEGVTFNSSSSTHVYSDEKPCKDIKPEGNEVRKEQKEGRPKTAPTVGDKPPRVLADLPKPFTSPQNSARKSPFVKLISKFKRSGSLPARDKENRIAT